MNVRNVELESVGLVKPKGLCRSILSAKVTNDWNEENYENANLMRDDVRVHNTIVTNYSIIFLTARNDSPCSQLAHFAIKTVSLAFSSGPFSLIPSYFLAAVALRHPFRLLLTACWNRGLRRHHLKSLRQSLCLPSQNHEKHSLIYQVFDSHFDSFFLSIFLSFNKLLTQTV